MKKKPEKQKKKVVVDEHEIERIGDRPVEYVMPPEVSKKPIDVRPQKTSER